MKLIKRAIILLALAICASSLSAAIPPSERQALIDLYNSTNGASWTNNSGWKTEPLETDGFAMPGTENTWYGITMDAGNTTVLSIDIQSNNLVGTLPASLGNLRNVTSLGLSMNQLAGSIPSSLGNLGNLEALGLVNNQLTGNIPTEFGNLSNLIYLNLSMNQLTGSIPSSLGNLGNLDTLDLQNNQITGNIPTELGNLSNLTYLNLSTNQLTGSILSSLGNLGNLDTLDLQNNQITGNIPTELGNLSNLTYLNLGSNWLTGSIPSSLGNLSNLDTFGLYYNQLSGNIPTELGNLRNLTFLSLGSNQLTGSIPPELGNLTNLTFLILNYNQLTGTIPPELGNLRNLTFLSLGSNWLTGSIPSSLGNLSNLYTFGLSSNQLTGNIPTELGNLSNLTDLSLDNNQISGSIPVSIGNLTLLQNLALSSNLLSGSLPTEMGNLTNLQYLYASSNQLSGSIPASFGNLTNAYYIYLYDNQLSGSIPKELGNLQTNLMVISLFDNQLTGEIPTALGNLTNLIDLTLDDNQMNGSIPTEIGNLTNLTYLRLRGNKFSGSIPSSLTNLVNLGTTTTDLGYNAFYSTDNALTTFLNSKDPDWASTQTVAPMGISAVAGGESVIVSWTPIEYIGDTGSYRIYYGTTGGGPYTFYSQTADKTATSQLVSGLTAGIPYYFVVQTRTDAHTGGEEGTNNANVVDSENSEEATAIPFPATFTISGTVTVGSAGLSNVVLNGLPGNPTTNASGFYTATVDYGWDGMATPTLAGYTFTPASTTYIDVAENKTNNYTAALNTFTISGTVTVGGSGLANVVLNGLPGTPTTNVSGAYTATINYGWGGTATPTLAGHTFTPVNRAYTNVIANQTGQDYAATLNAITMTSPNGGESWIGGSTHNITWTTVGTVANVKLEYSTNNGGAWTTITASTANANTYVWTLPSVSSTNCLVRVSNASGGVPADTSNAVFTIIIISITVTSPNGGESWDAGSTHNITWTTAGTVGNVKLEYSTNNGGAWTTIIASASSVLGRENDESSDSEKPLSNSYAWVLPAVASTTCLVRVSEASDGSPVDQSDAAFTIKKDKPIIGLSKTSFNFATVKKGKTTPADAVLITNPGGGTLKWAAASSAAWLVATPKTGPAGKTMKIKVVNVSKQAVGTYTATITITDPNAANSPATINVTLVVKAAGTDAVPIGAFDTPANGAVINTAMVAVSGWALDDVGMKFAKIYRQVSATKKALVGTAKFIVGARPDIEMTYPTYPQNNRAGWSYTLTMKKLPGKGVGTFVLMAYVQDLAGHLVLLGTHTITGVAPTGSAAVPFGSLDTPQDGGKASGSNYPVTGWALAPPPNAIPADAGALTLWVDGLAIGHPEYGAYREDVAAEYPDFANAAKAAGSFRLDTTKYADGWHMIAWSATDSGGTTGEIGSRYFRVQNKMDGSALTRAEDLDEDASPIIENEVPAARPISEIVSIPEDGMTPIFVKRGFTDDQTAETVYPDAADGSIRIQIPQVSRLAVYLNQDSSFENETEQMVRAERILSVAKNLPQTSRYQAFTLVGEELRPLPIGASFDARDGILFWQPGPGFLGEHQFVIVDYVSMIRKTIKITIS